MASPTLTWHPLALALALAVLAAVCSAHSTHFASRPASWADKTGLEWPQPADQPDDDEAAALPDLSGVWTGSPLGGATHRYFFTPASGGYGTAKDTPLHLHNSDSSTEPFPAQRPGTAYQVKCLTDNWQGGNPGGCGWDNAVCVLSADTPRPDPYVPMDRQFQHRARTNAKAPVTATCTFYASGQQTGSKTGAVAEDGCSIAMDLPWNRFCGPMSGLWRGPAPEDIYVVTHNQTSKDITVWWDSAITPVGGWSYGHGQVAADLSMYFNFNSFVYTGVVNADYSLIAPGPKGNWSGDWNKLPNQNFPSPIHTVHLVFMNHLDVGYASYINNINNEYFHGYFPKAAQLAEDMRSLGGTDSFVYVTHTWLMDLFFNCPCPDSNCTARGLNNPYAPPLKCPTQAEMDTFRAALKRQDIVWHAEPFDLQAENMSPELFEAGVLQCKNWDQEIYGANQTITMSDRDVIYVTRSVIPLLNKHGIRGLTIGSNGANYPPQVPKLHVWKDEASGTDVIVAYHPYGYGGYSKSTCAGPGQCGDCAEAPNGVALCTEFRTDNTGPPSGTDEVIASLDAVRQEYPHASVFASTFDKFIKAVEPVKDQLPVITKEVGDTWMYGVPSDPLKMAQNREIQRAWIECMQAGRPECAYDNKAIKNMTEMLLKAPEHTWGIPGVNGGMHYPKADFLQQLPKLGFLQAAATWAEQRIFNELAIQALEYDNHPLAPEVRARVSALSAVSAPSVAGLRKLSSPGQAVSLSHASATVAVDPSTGAFSTLHDIKTGVAWASQAAQLGQFVYHPLNDTDWNPFIYDYMNGHNPSGGFCKLGSNNYSESTYFRPTVTGVYTDDASRIVVAMAMPSRANERYGAPSTVYLSANFSRSATSGGTLAASMELVWLNKSATMIGESTHFNFQPAPARAGPWALNILGSVVDPEDVQDGGNQFQHGIWGGLSVKTESGTMFIDSLDAANALPLTKDFPYGNPLPAGSVGLKQLAKNSVFGMGFNLHNNLWNTNYPTWYPYYDPLYCSAPQPWACSNANHIFRFNLQFSA